jgi:hypothetical protein
MRFSGKDHKWLAQKASARKSKGPGGSATKEAQRKSASLSARLSMPKDEILSPVATLTGA